MYITKKNVNILIAGGFFLALLGLGLDKNIIKLPITKRIHAQWATDLSDDRKLVGISHNIFVARIIEQIGNKEDIIPSTQFSAEVILNIKGNLQGAITISQSGGYKNGVLHILEGGDVVTPRQDGELFFLQPGATYLLSAGYIESDNWYGVFSHPNASKKISDGGTLTKTQLQALATGDEKVMRLREIYPNEILYDVSIRHNKTYNAYISRPYYQNNHLIYNTS